MSGSEQVGSHDPVSGRELISAFWRAMQAAGY